MSKPRSFCWLFCLACGFWAVSSCSSAAQQTLSQPQATLGQPQALFQAQSFTKHDAVLVVDQAGNRVYEWQADAPLIPASLSKLATAQLAIEKWGLEHRFVTEFYRLDEVLWVKGYGDPFVVSEELDLIAAQLAKLELGGVTTLNVDNSYFNIGSVPGRSRVSDPYNAPLSAVSANFNTAKLRVRSGIIESAESQTPLTLTAKKLAGSLRNSGTNAGSERVNLVNADNAQRNFAELLIAKLNLRAVNVEINQRLPESAMLVYRHENSRTLADVLRGTLEFSNNFMANQVFLKLADQTEAASVAQKPLPVSFDRARLFAKKRLDQRFGWSSYDLREGSGLSRSNRLSAQQIDELLAALEPNKTLLKKIKSKTLNARTFAKTGTLGGVRTYAGYINFGVRDYRFVFMFNRNTPWRYREHLLETLIMQLASHKPQSHPRPSNIQELR